MGKKAKSVYSGYLVAQDAKQWDPNDEDFAAYWNKVKDNLFVLGDVSNQKIVFLNRELKDLAKKYEGIRVRITIEHDPTPPSATKPGKMPDPNEEFQGFEKFKRVAFNLFKIS